MERNPRSNEVSIAGFVIISDVMTDQRIGALIQTTGPDLRSVDLK